MQARFLILILTLCIFLFSSVKVKAEEMRLAVLHFDNLSGETKYQYLSRGFADTLVTALQYLPNIILVDRFHSEKIIKEIAFQQSGFTSSETSSKIGKLTGANKVITGSWQIQGEHMRVNVSLLNTETGEIDRSFGILLTGNINELFELQEELALEIIEKLQSKSSNITVKSINTVTTRSLQAYQYYLKGRELFLLATPDGYEQSINMYNKAVEIDNKYAKAWAGIAESFAFLGFYHEKRNNDYMQYYSKGLEAVEVAEQISSEIPEVFRAKAYIYNNMEPRQAEQAFQFAKYAININPNDAESIYILASSQGGNITGYEKALKINPYLLIARNDLGYALLKNNQFSKALEQFYITVKQEPKMYESHVGIAKVYMAQKEWKKALGKIKEIIINEFYPTADLYYMACVSSAKLQQYNEAIQFGKNAYDMNKNIGDITLVIGHLYEQNDNFDLSTLWYKRYIELNPDSKQAKDLKQNLKMRNLW